MNDSPEIGFSELASNIRTLRKSMQMTQKAFAKYMDVDQATVSRWEKGQSPGWEHMLKISQLCGLSFGDLISPEPPHSYFDVPTVKVIGTAQAGNLVESIFWEDWIRFDVAVPGSPSYPGINRFGLVVNGAPMDQVYRNESIVICARLVDIGLSNFRIHGSHVVVLQRDGEFFEVSIRELHVDTSGEIWLLSRTDHPAFASPIKAPDLMTISPYVPFEERDDEIEIYAKVLGVYTPVI